MEDLGSHYEARYQCGPDEKQTEVRVIENEWRDRVLWSYVVRPGGIMCKCILHPVTNYLHITYAYFLQFQQVFNRFRSTQATRTNAPPQKLSIVIFM